MKNKFGLLKLEQNLAEIYLLGGKEERKLKDIYFEGKNTSRFYKDVAKELARFNGLVLAGHGKGSANEAQKFLHYVRKHFKSFLPNVIGHIVTDHHETEKSLLAKADAIAGEKHIGNHNS